MPSRNRIKQYAPDHYYHLYNRGVEKRVVFEDDQDYGVFMSYLKLYLSPPMFFSKPHKDISHEVELAAFCLMPNHFHLLVRQHTCRGIEALMRCVISNYVSYFNRRHGRVGKLFQDSYKAVRVASDAQLYQIVQYIHDNPKRILEDVREYPYSSLYNGNEVPEWLSPPAGEGRTLYRDEPYLVW